MKLTKAMKAQLLECLHDVQQKGEYWGDKKQFWKRHDKIVAWVYEQKYDGALKKLIKSTKGKEETCKQE